MNLLGSVGLVPHTLTKIRNDRYETNYSWEGGQAGTPPDVKGYFDVPQYEARRECYNPYCGDV